MSEVLTSGRNVPVEKPIETPMGEAGWLRANRRVVLVAWGLCAVLAALVGVAFDNPWLGIGPDPDDVMRFVQIRDLLEGQGWFDLSQTRLGPEGTPIHWSRLSDLPFVMVALALEPFAGTDTAIRVAGSVVPGLVAGLFALGVLRGMAVLGPDGMMERTRLPMVAAVAVALHMFMFTPRFAFGAFDHHHLQIALLALAVGFSLVRTPRAGDGAVSGLSVAASLTIGLESAPFLGAICAFWAGRWWLSGGDREAVAAFGASLAAGALAGWAVFTDGGIGSGVSCDSFALPLAPLLILGGAGMWLGAARGFGVVRVGGMAGRTVLLVLLALAAGAMVALGAPECAGNPMDALPVDVRDVWLAGISEARPATSPAINVSTLAGLMGVPMAACLAGLLMAWRRRDPAWIWLVVLCAGGLLMCLYQVRFHIFAGVPAAIILARVLVDVLGWERHADGREVSPLTRLPLTLAVLVASSPVALITGVEIVTQGEGDSETVSVNGVAEADKPECGGEAVLAALAALPQGRVFTSLDLAPEVIRATPHVPMAGNYHRGGGDIARWLRLAATPAGDAVPSLRAAGVDYLMVCEGGKTETAFAGTYPEGLYRDPARLSAVAGLEEVARPNDWVRILRVQAE